MNVQRIDLQKIPDPRGNLSVVEQFRDVPFDIARAFLMYDVPGGEIRGGHAYKQSQEFIIALSGSFDVVIDEGGHKHVHSLNRSYYGLYVPNGVWRHMENFSTNSLALVLSSTHYDETDYLYDHADYQAWLKKDAILSKRMPSFRKGCHPQKRMPSLEKGCHPFEKDAIPLPQGRRFLDTVSLMDLPRIEFREGNITPLEGWRPLEEGESQVPFDIKRVFYIYDIPGGESRGAHAHKQCHQLIIAASGSFDVLLDNGHEQATVTLNRPYQGLHVPPGIWCHEAGFSSGAVCLVLTSELFDEADYIRDYNEYLLTGVPSPQKGCHPFEKDAIPSKGCHPIKKDAILFYDLQRFTTLHKDAIKEAVDRVIDKGWFLLGQEVETFERHYAAYIGTKHCIGVANGLDALRLILRAYKELGRLQDGDDVLVPANTYIATILAITDNNLNPVLVEPNPLTLQIDENRLEAAFTNKTKALMIVHLYGQNAWTEAIAAFCNTHGLLLVEDNAQAAGCVASVPTTPGVFATPGTTPGRQPISRQPISRQKTGSLGHAAGHSFYPTKPLGALGDGGAVTTNDDILAKTIRSLANYGSSRKYVFPYQGYNSRLDELQAATLDVKLRYLDSENERRRSVARQYKQGLNHPAIELPALSLNDDNVYHLFPILVKANPLSTNSFITNKENPLSTNSDVSNKDTPSATNSIVTNKGNSPSTNQGNKAAFRDALQQYLTEQGIQTQIHYPIPPHKQACYSMWNNRSYPITEAIHDSELSLPISPVMTDDEVQRVIETINSWISDDNE